MLARRRMASAETLGRMHAITGILSLNGIVFAEFEGRKQALSHNAEI